MRYRMQLNIQKQVIICELWGLLYEWVNINSTIEHLHLVVVLLSGSSILDSVYLNWTRYF